MNAPVEYSQADIAKAAKFMARMMPYLAQGMTMQEAGEAVIKRDAELTAAVCYKSDVRQAFVADMASRVYNEIRR